MTRRSPKRPTLDRFEEINLRLFIDTNVLIDFTEGFDERSSKKFVNLFKNNKFDNIELVTSDYVLWEFYGHFKDELYVRKLIKECHYGHVSANKECIRRKFRKAALVDMEAFGKRIKEFEQQFAENPISIQKLIGRNLSGFSETVEAILRCSKFSYKDTIIFVSALYTRSPVIVTLDETFSSESHLKELKEALQNLKTVLKLDVEFKKPVDFATKTAAKRSYKNWFLKHNKKKQIGKVIGVWPKKNAIAIQCLKKYFVKKGDYLCVVKFWRGTDFRMKIFEITKGNLRDYDTDKEVSQGKKVTVRLPSGTKSETYMNNGMVFLYSYME